jgi:hypothetical protein
MTAALKPIIEAVEQLLMGDTLLGALLTTVEPGRVASGTKLNYLTFTAPSETGFNLFARPGSDGSLQINIWAKTYELVVDIWTHIHRLLQNQDLAVQNHMHIRGQAHLVTIMDDPDSEAVIHGVVRYEWTTLSR